MSKRPNLVIAAYWTHDDHDLATTKLAVSMKGHIPDSGAVVSLDAEKVDATLRRFLRAVQLDEAADFNPVSPSPRATGGER
jgi:hypothetical protein